MQQNKLIKALKLNYIDNGRYKVGDKLPTARELSMEYDVSSATIVKAFDELYAEGVITRIQGKGVFIEKQNKENKYIGLVGLSPDYEIMISYIKGVNQACKRFGFELIPGNFYSGWNKNLEREEIYTLIKKGCQGIILIPTPRKAKEVKKDYLNTELLEFPIVLLDTGTPKLHRVQVTYNYKKEAYDLTKYFIDLNYKNIYMIHDYLKDITFNPPYFRYLGYKEAMIEANLEVKIIRLKSNQSLHYIKELNKQNPIDIIICRDDREAKSLSDGFRLENIDNIKLAGFDNLSETLSYPFVTTDIDEVMSAEFSVEVLLKLITGEYNNNHVFMINSKVIIK
ncbi:MAG: GntR family transcriptional regulator [Abditibacteriota bacterium]|nr:GntR family transcriptional regulator [Abditibacteriota bacterium]